nr:MAG TPA_asm: hypothetical protein [Caudoviricetes sp.]
MVQAKTTISRNGARAPSAGDSLPALMMAGSAAQRRGISPSVSLRSTAPSSEGAKEARGYLSLSLAALDSSLVRGSQGHGLHI